MTQLLQMKFYIFVQTEIFFYAGNKQILWYYYCDVLQ